MKKIIRIASVIALASASLLYVGCTKDFSADIAKTNQDVAALNQKIETLNSTVQTINGTVENLKTTKADLSAVNALGDKVTTAEGKITTLGGKIDDLDGKLTSTKNDLTAAIATAKQEAIDAASVDAAAKLAAAKTELEGVINGVKAKVDSLEAFTVAQTDSLRKDVDSLYANCEALEARIAALEGRVDALAARITSIVAVPSTNAEFRYFSIDTSLTQTKDTTFFAATFAITPKAAVEKIAAKDLKVNFKEGLTRVASLDTTFDASKVIVDKKNGNITVFAGFNDPTIVAATHKIYYSLSFVGKDEAGCEYEENSDYVAAQAYDANNKITIANSKVFVEVKGDEFEELPAAGKTLKDTLAFNAGDGKQFGKLLTTDSVTVAFNVNGKLLSAKDLGELVGVAINVAIDSTLPVTHTAGFKVTSNGTQLYKATKDSVANVQTVSAKGFVVNKHDYACPLTEKHVIGAKTVTFTLPAISEPWTYTSPSEVSRTVSIPNCKDIQEVVGENEILADGAALKNIFKIKKDSGTGVDIAVTKAKRSTAAKDTVYNVVFEKKANLGADRTNADTVNFAINWKYTLEGRPADKTIALADVDTSATGYNSPIEVAIDKDIVAKTYAAFDAAYDKTIDSAAVTTAIKNAGVAIDSVVFGGKRVDNVAPATNAVKLPPHSKAGAYSVVLHKIVYGIKYTYTYTINLEWKEALKLHATPYVSAGVAKVDADTTGNTYTLDNMVIAKYIQVFNADTLAKGFDGYTVKLAYKLENKANFVDPVTKDTIVGNIDLDTTSLVIVNDGTLEAGRVLKWNDYKGREVEITAYLVIADTVKADSCTFKLQYDKPITSFSAGTQTIKRVAGQDAEAVISKSFNIKGLYNGNKNLIVDTTGAWINGKNYYGCEIKYNIDKASFKVNGETATLVSGTDFTFDAGTATTPESAKITFLGDNNNKNIEASIPVTLTYKYDYNHADAYNDNVVIKVVNE